MMMMTMFAAGAATTCNTGAKCCCNLPLHAYLAIAGLGLVCFLIGFFLGRRGAKKTCACAKKGAPAAPRKREARASEPRPPIPAGSVEIYVGNLSYDLTEEQLQQEFAAFGTVASARIVSNKGRSKGFGFVVMPNRPEAEKAIAAMSEKDVLGRKMRVNEARNTVKEEA